jgi:hypothetical protein
MTSIRQLLRLGAAGLLLDSNVFTERRTAEHGVREGFQLVLLIGLLIGLAGSIGAALQTLASPNPSELVAVLRNGLSTIALSDYLLTAIPGSRAALDAALTSFEQLLIATAWWNLLSGLLMPLLLVLFWLANGALTHGVARSLGGEATLRQTLACTAPALGSQLLAVVQIVPFAQVAGSWLLGAIAWYLALRAAHQLPAWQAFWAALSAPLLLLLLLSGACCFLLIAGLFVN